MADIVTRNDDSEDIEEPEVPKNGTNGSAPPCRAGAKPRILKGHLPDPPKEKKERTPAQIAAFERARASREANLKKKNEDAKRLAEYDALIVKQKLMEKANKLKLKTMKKVEVIESVSSEEDEVVIEKPKAKAKPKEEPKTAPAPTPVPAKKVIPYKFV